MSKEIQSNKVSNPIQRSPKAEEASEKPKTTITRVNSWSERLSGRSTFSNRPTQVDYTSRTTFAHESHADVLLRRTMTVITQADPDNEESWTKGIIQTYKIGSDKSVAHGTMPAPAAFARDYNFWKAFTLSAVLGAFLGLCTLVFMNIADKIPRVWVNGGPTTTDNDFFICGDCSVKTCVCNKFQNCQWYEGKLEWIAITASAGFVVGCIRFFSAYPDNLPGLFQEIQAFHVDPTWAPYTIVLSAISLAGGASLGPEQGLGNLGGGLATYITEHYLHFEDDDYRKLSVLGGMTAALGALLPSPILGVLMFHELGEPPK
jgi:H+/Cl- antiporter ClcA